MNSAVYPISVENSKSELLGRKISGLDLNINSSNEEKTTQIQKFFQEQNLSETIGYLYMQKFIIEDGMFQFTKKNGKYSLWDFLEMNFPDFTTSLKNEKPSETVLSQTTTHVNEILSPEYI